MSKSPKECLRTSGGKGNIGMFIERDLQVMAAGTPSSQPNETVKDALQYYLLQHKVDAIINDAIIPLSKPPQPSPRYQKRDMRNAGIFSEGTLTINPHPQTKFQDLVEDLKNTIHSSYWKKPLGTVPDQVPRLPDGFHIYGTTLGKKSPSEITLYEVIMPTNPVPQQTPISKLAAQQTNRHYCRPSFDPNMTFGKKENVDPRGRLMKCALQDDRRITGTANYIPMNMIQADHIFTNQSRLGKSLAPNDNISFVPKGYSFGVLEKPDNIIECFSHCELNEKREFYKKCLASLNCLRKVLKKLHGAPFFKTMYLKLKYNDKKHSGWIPKDVVYNYCASVLVRFDPVYIEPLLACWDAFNGTEIEYRTFVLVINHTQGLPDLPKVWDIPEECIDYRTTYSEMVKPQEPDVRKMAGVPSGRYFDKDYPVTPNGYCKADRFYLPDETDVCACLCPSTLTLLGVTHRDMYAERSPEVVKRVFQNVGEKFTDEQFEGIWNEAKKYHSQGIVCFETFRRSLNKYNSDNRYDA